VSSFGFLDDDFDDEPTLSHWNSGQPVFVLRAPLHARAARRGSVCSAFHGDQGCIADDAPGPLVLRDGADPDALREYDEWSRAARLYMNTHGRQPRSSPQDIATLPRIRAGRWITFPGDVLSDRDVCRASELCSNAAPRTGVISLGSTRYGVSNLVLSVESVAAEPPTLVLRVRADLANLGYGRRCAQRASTQRATCHST
jgi:hypothetical protein